MTGGILIGIPVGVALTVVGYVLAERWWTGWRR